MPKLTRRRLATCAGVDVGGTFAKLVAVSSTGKIVVKEEMPTEPELGPAAFVDRVGAVVDQWRLQRGLEVLGLGLALAGDVDSRFGALRLAPNLPGWAGFSFKRAFERRLELSVAVENDANAAVWGGYKVELKSRPRNVVGVTLGTGVGGGLIVEGRLYRGSTGSAGEIGHTQIERDGELCHCGGRGHLEAYAGSYGIVRAARRLLARSPAKGKLLRALSPDPDAITPALLSQAADDGDPLARQVWEETANRLAVGLGNLVLVMNPDAVLILGGVSRAGRWLLDPIRAYFERQPFRTPFGSAKIRLADNQHAGGLGAALLALEEA